MEGIVLIAILIGLAIFIGTIVSFVNLKSISDLRNETHRLNKIVELQRQQLTKLFQHLESLSKPSKEANSAEDNSPVNQEKTNQHPLESKLDRTIVPTLNTQGSPDTTTSNIDNKTSEHSHAGV